MKFLNSIKPAMTALAISTALIAPAHATENGRSSLPPGLNGTEIGVVPPADGHVYVIWQNVYIDGDSFKDSNGDDLFLDFESEIIATAPRFVFFPGIEIAGLDLGVYAIVPFGRLTVDNPAPMLPPGAPMTPPGPIAPGVPGSNPFGSDSKTAFGDPLIGPVLAYRGKNLHAIAAVDVNIPIGQYDANRLANLGLGTWTINPTLAATWYPTEGLELSGTTRLDIHYENDDTNYNSGDLLAFEFAANTHHQLGDGNRLTLGVGGYAQTQLTDDRVNGVPVNTNFGAPPSTPLREDGFRTQAFGVGPTVAFRHKSGAQLELKFQEEFGVENRTSGRRAFLHAYLRF